MATAEWQEPAPVEKWLETMVAGEPTFLLPEFQARFR
jgi:hypothetical protein